MKKNFLYLLIISTIFMLFINILNAEIAVSEVNILPIGNKIVAKGSTIQLTTEIGPEGATYNSLIWSSDKPLIAEVDNNGLVTARDYGDAEITVTVDGISQTKNILVRADILYNANGGTLSCDNGVVPNDGSDVPLAILTVGGVATGVHAFMDKDYKLYQLFTDTTGVHCSLVREHYTFKGWYTASEGGTKIDENATFGTVRAERETVYAQWEDNRIKVNSIELTTSNLNVVVGENAILGVIVRPTDATDKSLQLSLSSSDYAEVEGSVICPIGYASIVSDGMIFCYSIRGKAVGNNTVLTVETEDGSNKTATVNINVTEAVVPVTGLSFVYRNLMIIKGSDKKFNDMVNIVPSEAENVNLIYEIADPTIVKNHGNCTINGTELTNPACIQIEGLKDGETDIIVKLASDESIMATQHVKVVTEVKVTGINIVQDTVHVPTDKSRIAQVIFTPANTTNKQVSWTSSNPDVASVVQIHTSCVVIDGYEYISAGANCLKREETASNTGPMTYVIVGKAPGTATLTVHAIDGEEITDTIDVVVENTVDENIITYDCNGGTGTMGQDIVSKNDKIMLKKNICTKEGYTFKGWKAYANNAVLKDSSGKDYEYSDQEVFTNIFGSEKGQISLKAVWVSKTVPNAKTGISRPIMALFTIALISLVTLLALRNKKVEI
jgi:uncharacterized repeat protein (TIGR02543 family)